MYLQLLLALALWGSESHSAPMQVATMTPEKNYIKLCDEIESELSAEHETYKGDFSKPQNTSEELCYGAFTKNFTSTLKELSDKYKQDPHIVKVYKDMRQLTKVCAKLEPTDSPSNCAIEQSDFSNFKEALKTVITSIAGWQSCQKIQGNLWGAVLSWS